MIRSSTVSAPAPASTSLAGKLLLVLLFQFLVSDIFSGALRYYLPKSGLAPLIYAPKVLLLLALLVAVASSVIWLRLSRLLAAGLLLIATYVVIGTHFTQFRQSAFGAFVLLPLLYGLLCEPALRSWARRLPSWCFLLWSCAALGIAISVFINVPWSGASYLIAGSEIEGSREWTALGINRVAGFSRASFEAANHLLYLGIPLVILVPRRVIGILLWLATGVGIALTTTKRTVGVFLFLSMLIPLLQSSLTPLIFKRFLARAIPISTAVIGVVMPISTLFVQYKLNFHDIVSIFLFASFEDRLTMAWPDAFALLWKHGDVFLGRGVGGIGAAQHYFEPTLYTFADNMYLYCYVTFGFMALPLILLYVRSISRLRPWERTFDMLVWLLAVSVLMCGWAVNGFEGPFTSILIGITLAYAHARSQANRISVAQKFGLSNKALFGDSRQPQKNECGLPP